MSTVSITACSMCNALGDNRKDIAHALKNGSSGLTPSVQDIPFNTFDGKITAELPQLEGELKSWSTRSAQIVALLLQRMQGELTEMMQRWDHDRVAIIMGTSTAGADKTEDAYKKFLQVGSLPDDYDLWKHHTYGATLHVVRQLTGATGPAWMHSTACTSSAKPFGTAKRLIQAGIIDAAIVGGIDTLCAMTLRGFHALSALSEDYCAPFSANRKGINIGEGGALMLLEKTSDGLAHLTGVGESSDAYHIAAPHPKGQGAELAMQRALDDAGLKPEDIGHINAHGTGTKLNDSAESKAIARLFGHDIPVVSTKGYTGHTLGGAGATEIAFSLLALQESWIPESLRAEPIDEKISIHIPTAMTQFSSHHVLSNSFAFGGNNISVILSLP